MMSKMKENQKSPSNAGTWDINLEAMIEGLSEKNKKLKNLLRKFIDITFVINSVGNMDIIDTTLPKGTIIR